MKNTEEMIKNTLNVINEMFFNGEKITYYAVAKNSNVSRSFLYNHEELNSKIYEYRNYNKMSLKKRVEYYNQVNNNYLDSIKEYEDKIMRMLEKI